MPLPKPQHPIFSATIPSTKQKIKFRAFTVREEKMLLLAQETEDLDTILNAVKAVIQNCVEGEGFSVDKLALFDLEFMMTQIRSKSVGEIVTLLMPCSADASHERTTVKIDLSKIGVVFDPNHKTNIPLYDDVGIAMKYPTIDQLNDTSEIKDLDAVLMCIDYIYDSDEIFHASEQTKEELEDFVASLTKAQFQKIEDEFFKTMPRFEYEFSYKCVKCGTEHNKVIKGLSNFFV